MKALFAVGILLVILIGSSSAHSMREERRLQKLISQQVFAAFDAYHSVNGRYPQATTDIADLRLAALKAEPKMKYLPENNGRAFQFHFRVPGTLGGSQWDIRNDRREWSLDR